MTGLTAVALPLSVIASALYGLWLARRPVGLLRSATKVAATGFLALAALDTGGPWSLFSALLFCAIGDWFLSRDGERAFLAGMAAFAIGHALFIALFLRLGADPGYLAERWLAAPALLVLAGLMLALLWPRLGRLRWPVAGYVAVIVAMGVSALALPRVHMPVLQGALAFILSDAILAAELFLLPEDSPARRLSPHLVWLFYWGGLVAIAGGVLIFPV